MTTTTTTHRTIPPLAGVGQGESHATTGTALTDEGYRRGGRSHGPARGQGGQRGECMGTPPPHAGTKDSNSPFSGDRCPRGGSPFLSQLKKTSAKPTFMKTKKKPQPTCVLASTVLGHVLKNKTPFPLPPTYDEEVVNDISDDPRWNAAAFTSVTKAWFSRWHGVDGGQVSRWLQAGLPVMANGRLLLSVADRWLDEYRAEDPDRRDPKGRARTTGNELTEEEIKQMHDAIERWEKSEE